MPVKKSAKSKSKPTAKELSEQRRKVKLGVSSEAARKAPARIAGGDDDLDDLEVER
ncbi:MAG: hypothetical protein M1453_02550 [Acidobacteria bacterium]|nr:hypothetical protein [Acidobacteriota bacterium]MCL5286863.1 hypothetical protein [Acidobacteriota bacterium]